MSSNGYVDIMTMPQIILHDIKCVFNFQPIDEEEFRLFTTSYDLIDRLFMSRI